MIESCTRASLVFDLARIEANMRRVAEAAHASGIRALFAAKSFPHPAVRAIAAELLDGFDVASMAEARDVPRGRIVSVADPTGAARAHGERVIYVCETIDQVRAAPGEVAIRVSASITGRDPAVGAVLEGSGRRRSRFGIETRDELAALAHGRRVGLHVHHGPVVATSAERFIATARAVLALADFTPAFLDLGGAWHGIADLARAFAEVRAAVPSEIELIVEPGRLYADGAGSAVGFVQSVRTLAADHGGGRASPDRRERHLCVLDLSRICHLRWSPVELVARAPHPGTGRPVLFVGPTCFEEDVIGEWTIDPSELGARVVLRGVTGYALGWNTGFGGVAPADVIIR